MNTLHIVNKVSVLDNCLEHISAEDGLILIEDAVIASQKPSQINRDNLMVLSEDLIARGIKLSEDSSWKSIDMSEFVKQTISYSKSISWL